jgi:hypothetical protein
VITKYKLYDFFTKDVVLDIVHVATLALGLQPRQGLARLWAKREARESHLMFPGVQNNVKE